MKYGLIGEKLGHSFSPQIHMAIADYKYELKEIPKDDLDAYMKAKDFNAINVTIPYKQDVIPYLTHISDSAQRIGAVNTIVNKNGELFGDNTDYFGMKSLFEYAGIIIKSSYVLILGSGGTSKTAHTLIEDLGASKISHASRHPKSGEISYDNLGEIADSVEIIVNTTPVGMFPHNEGCPVDLDLFKNLKGVADVVYNPLRTNLILEAKKRGIPAMGGLYMLVAQAVYASAIFRGIEPDDSLCEKVYLDLLKQKENIVLIGMPSCGKTSVGKALSKKMGLPLVDTDDKIIEKIGTDIASFMAKNGEEVFRDVESEVVFELSAKTGLIIATGGGAILREKNVKSLSQNGRLVFLNRNIKDLEVTKDRPLSSDIDKLKAMYEKRLPAYKRICDIELIVDADVNTMVQRVLRELSYES